jgi:hypothetical protein
MLLQPHNSTVVLRDQRAQFQLALFSSGAQVLPDPPRLNVLMLLPC